MTPDKDSEMLRQQLNTLINLYEHHLDLFWKWITLYATIVTAISLPDTVVVLQCVEFIVYSPESATLRGRVTTSRFVPSRPLTQWYPGRPPALARHLTRWRPSCIVAQDPNSPPTKIPDGAKPESRSNADRHNSDLRNTFIAPIPLRPPPRPQQFCPPPPPSILTHAPPPPLACPPQVPPPRALYPYPAPGASGPRRASTRLALPEGTPLAQPVCYPTQPIYVCAPPH